MALCFTAKKTLRSAVEFYRQRVPRPGCASPQATPSLEQRPHLSTFLSRNRRSGILSLPDIKDSGSCHGKSPTSAPRLTTPESFCIGPDQCSSTPSSPGVADVEGEHPFETAHASTSLWPSSLASRTVVPSHGQPLERAH